MNLYNSCVCVYELQGSKCSQLFYLQFGLEFVLWVPLVFLSEILPYVFSFPWIFQYFSFIEGISFLLFYYFRKHISITSWYLEGWWNDMYVAPFSLYSLKMIIILNDYISRQDHLFLLENKMEKCFGKQIGHVCKLAYVSLLLAYQLHFWKYFIST